eukprot:403358146
MCAYNRYQGYNRSKTVETTTLRDDQNPLKMFTYVNNGVVEPYKDFKVDNFYSNRKEQFTFFLSHMHEDHLRGLSKRSEYGNYGGPDEDWQWGTIYTSPKSKNILLLRFPNLKPYVRALELYKQYTIKDRTVMLYEANHCPGAVMFLFKGAKGTVLHTGDFRFKPSMIDYFTNIKIDYLYLDNTFATTDEDFPPQEEAFEKLYSIIEHKRGVDQNYQFHLFCYTLGKEEVFHNLAQLFSTKIMMQKDRITKLNAIGMGSSKFVTRDEWSKDKTGDCFIQVKVMKDLPKTKEDCDKKKNVHFLCMTGWKNQYNINHPRFHKIPYSSHSSYKELDQFVKSLKPGKLVFTVPDHSPKMAKSRFNFQKKLLSYTDAGKDIEFQPIIQQQKLSFKSVTQVEREISEPEIIETSEQQNEEFVQINTSTLKLENTNNFVTVDNKTVTEEQMISLSIDKETSQINSVQISTANQQQQAKQLLKQQITTEFVRLNNKKRKFKEIDDLSLLSEPSNYQNLLSCNNNNESDNFKDMQTPLNKKQALRDIEGTKLQTQNDFASLKSQQRQVQNQDYELKQEYKEKKKQQNLMVKTDMLVNLETNKRLKMNPINPPQQTQIFQKKSTQKQNQQQSPQKGIKNFFQVGKVLTSGMIIPKSQSPINLEFTDTKDSQENKSEEQTIQVSQ